MVKKIFVVFFILTIIIISFLAVDTVRKTTDSTPKTDTEYTDFSTTSTTVPTKTETTVQSSAEKPDLNAGKLVVANKDGDLVATQGAFGSADVSELSSGFSELFSSENEEESKWFDIFYDEPTRIMTVYLYWEPLREARDRATNVLLEKLGLSTAELCDLDVRVQTNIHVNEVYAGYENLGLSFCPDSIPLP